MLENEVRQDIEDLHSFFVGWYNGTLPDTAFETEFLARLDPAFAITMPSGVSLDLATLSSTMRNSFGGNKGFRIEIRNVRLVHVTESTVTATYEEWQRKEARGGLPGNARISTVLMSRGETLRWLHVQETWLPEEIVNADSFNF